MESPEPHIINAEQEQFAQWLENEHVYAENLARQLGMVTGSRLWRAAQWLRRLTGRGALAPDFDRPAPLRGRSAGASMAEVFREIYVKNAWGSEISRSGTVSDLVQTASIRETLPALLGEFGVRAMIDIPCGDFHWMQLVDLEVDYIGADAVPDIIAANRARYGNEQRRFELLDITRDLLPRVDLVFCRDLLVHFSFDDALRAIADLKPSGSTLVLTTTFAHRSAHVEVATGQWRPINLRLPLFNFPPPLRLINERCSEHGADWADKSLGLWRLVDLRMW